MKSAKSIIGLAVLLAALAMSTPAGDTITWKPLANVILRIDDRAPKQWNIYSAGKKEDTLLLQLGARALVIYVRNQQVYEIQPAQFSKKGQDLVWRESNKPERPLVTSDWSTRDVGSARRIRMTLTAEGRTIDIQLPQSPDLRGLY
jgi:hypothetical protein